MEVCITIDGREVSVPQGTTVLVAAEKLGVDIPTLCHTQVSCSPESVVSPTSCLVCLVKVNGRAVPACATPVVPGMNVESETQEVHILRRTALELLLSDHRGDCYAPCVFACPAKMDIPQMLRDLVNHDLQQAIRTIKERIPLPSVLGRVCPKPCERICRRKERDEPVSICQLKRFIGDSDLGANDPYIPPVAPSTGKTVAVFGAGSCGLSAAYYLTILGHHVVLLEQQAKPGGRLRNWDEDVLPQEVLETEIDHLLRLPIQFEGNSTIDFKRTGESGNLFEGMMERFDALLLATGTIDGETAEILGVEMKNSHVVVDQGTFRTKREKLFAAGTLIRGKQAMIVRSVADGREAADEMDDYLRNGSTTGWTQSSRVRSTLYSVRLGRLQPDELAVFLPNGSSSTRKEPEDAGLADYQMNEAVEQANRCLHCDCRGREKCRLLKWSEKYEARTQRFRETSVQPLLIKRSGNILFEPAKCIKCGVCVSLTESASDLPGLAFLGRGFDVQVGVPFDETLEKGLGDLAEQCVTACPTAALAFCHS
ncbi:MAG: 2Fe-2S iron-sulfur cluster-binding protein [Thermoguttaceae bacterium]